MGERYGAESKVRQKVIKNPEECVAHRPHGWHTTGRPCIGLEYELKIKLPLSRVFCGGHFEFLIHARGLEPKLKKSLGATSEL